MRVGRIVLPGPPSVNTNTVQTQPLRPVVPIDRHKDLIREAKEAAFRAGWDAYRSSHGEWGPHSDVDTEVQKYLDPPKDDER